MIKNTLPEVRKTLADYEQSVKRGIQHIKNAFHCHDLAEKELETVGKHIYPSEFKYGRLRLDAAIDHVNRQAWRRLMSVTGLSKTFDSKAMDEFDKALEKSPVIEFTAANAKATIERLAGDQDLMFSRGLVGLFKSLSGNYRSNSAFKVNKRSVIKNVICSRWGGMQHGASDACNDLSRVVCALTGQDYQPFKMWGEWESCYKKGADYKDNYISVKFFQNGNGHLYIHDAGLLNRINGVIAEWFGDRAIGGDK